MEERAAWPSAGLTATATHDTKRGEDARARLIALSEVATEWIAAVREWRELNRALIDRSAEPISPQPAHEYMLYQSLLGAWPVTEIDETFVQRMASYAVKAAREGKQQTSWLVPNESYEAGLQRFLRNVLDREQSPRFIASFEAFARRAALLGALNGLSQLALKATMPGVPDFYQGTEFWDLSLVDPDNRRRIDYSARQAVLHSLGEHPDWHALAQSWPDGRIKLALTRCLLSLRNRQQDLFTGGGYSRLQVRGPQSNEIIAFARIKARRAIIAIVARSFARASRGGRQWPLAQEWDASIDTSGFTQISDALNPRELVQGGAVSDLLGPLPVAILQADYAPAKGARRMRDKVMARTHTNPQEKISGR
jgi:(1->4)-alpha-D-glucan 1-alpha-D-glucosylmutase